MQRLALIERIEGVQEQFLERCAASGVEREYWRPEYALAVKAAEVFKVVFPEYENRQRALKALNRTLFISSEMGRRRILVGFNGNREVLLPAESSALDAYARVVRTEGWDYRFVPTGYRVRYVYGDVEDTQNMMHGLYEGEHLDVAFEGDFVILPDLLRFNALKTFEGKLVMYKAAVRACKYYRSRRLKSLGFYESKRVMRAFEGLYGRNVRLLNG